MQVASLLHGQVAHVLDTTTYQGPIKSLLAGLRCAKKKTWDASLEGKAGSKATREIRTVRRRDQEIFSGFPCSGLSRCCRSDFWGIAGLRVLLYRCWSSRCMALVGPVLISPTIISNTVRGGTSEGFGEREWGGGGLAVSPYFTYFHFCFCMAMTLFSPSPGLKDDIEHARSRRSP